jgi:hypothetical protein
MTELRIEILPIAPKWLENNVKWGFGVGFGSLDSMSPQKHQHPVFPRSGRRDLEHDRFERNVRIERFEYSYG